MADTDRAVPLRLQCQECRKRFRSATIIPECPRCGGVDIELEEESGWPGN